MDFLIHSICNTHKDLSLGEKLDGSNRGMLEHT